MLASVARDVPSGVDWAFEPKYDGIRVLAFATPKAAALVTRNAKDKSAQFPEIVAALRAHAARARRELVLDGEIVALRNGSPARFQQLQARMHVQNRAEIARHARDTPVAFVAFDILVDADDVLIDEPWTERRVILERRLRSARRPLLLGESERDANALLARARRERWEGIIAKRVDAPYHPGSRSRAWLKLKLEHRQEFVVGGWTEPRLSRPHLGALLLGYYRDGRFVYAGHMGGGFTQRGLKEMYDRLRRIERPDPPFEKPPKTNEPAHWVEPQVVVEVRFNEWTDDGKLRQPIFLGVREDKEARDVTREPTSTQPRRRTTGATSILAQLTRIEGDRGDGELHFEDGRTLRVTSLGKIFFPEPGFTKGDLLRYYARLAPLLLPLIDDRPLALRRFPDGVTGSSFYQQNAGAHLPEGLRVAEVTDVKGKREPRFIGGDLPTLLYTAQLGSIDVHSWLSRLSSLDHPDYAILDLDPGPGVELTQITQVARAIARVLEEHGIAGALKTSGSRGLHVAIPLAVGMTYAEGSAVAEAVARRTAEREPDLTTMERRLKSRPRGTIYLDHQQNARGKTVAAAYAVRARPGATVSMPIEWSSLRRTLDPAAFTIATVPRRTNATKRSWSAILAKGNGRRSLQGLLD